MMLLVSTALASCDAGADADDDGSDASADVASDGGLVGTCELPDYFVVSPDAALEGAGWHRVYVQGGSAEPYADGSFGMTELRHEVGTNDHFILSPGAFVEWRYPVAGVLTGNVFAHMARTNDPGVVVRYELIYVPQEGPEVALISADDSDPGNLGYAPFERCFGFEPPAASDRVGEGDVLLLRASNLTGGMLGIVTQAPDYFTWIDVEVE